jgi:sec-independent protein translocase protein TatC
MLFFHHLKELKYRLLYLILTLFLLIFIGFHFHQNLLNFLVTPISHDLHFLLSTHPLETILSYLLTSCYFAFLLIIPILSLHFKMFLLPSLYSYESNYLSFLILKYLLIISLSSLFVFFKGIPLILDQLITDSSTLLKIEIRIWNFNTFLFFLHFFLTLNFSLPFILQDLNILPSNRVPYYGFTLILLTFIAPTDKAFFLLSLLYFLIYECHILWNECIRNRTQDLRVKSP